MSSFRAWREASGSIAAAAVGVADAAGDAFEPIVRHEGRDSYPLSFSQERLWFLSQLDPSSAAYNCPHAVRFLGELNPLALEASIHDVVRRLEVLRTAFELEDDRPVQRVRPFVPRPIALVDLRSVPLEERRAAAIGLARADAARPFDLSRGDLLRVTLIRLHDAEHLGLFTMHHIIADDWSVGVFSREITDAYRALQEGRHRPSGEPQVQYGDFAVWQRTHVESSRWVREREYWLEQLRDAPVLALRTDRPRPKVQAHRGAKEFLSIPRGIADRLRQLAETENATLFMGLLCALQLLLARHAGQRDVAVGVPIAGRTRPDLEPLVGVFLNTLVMRTRIAGHPSFRELLRQVRETALDAYACQDVPFEQLVERLRPERDPSYHALFQVMFVHQQRKPLRVELPALAIETLDTVGETAKFDLTFMITENDAGLSLSIEFDTALFDRASVAVLKNRFAVLLESAVETPDCGVFDLDMLPAAERALVHESSAGPDVDYLHAPAIGELFTRQVATTPDATALVDGDRYLTYGMLMRCADDLARRLAAVGVGPEGRVGLHVERSAESVIAMLGIVRAGGAYLPLDPGYPHGRLAELAFHAVLDAIVSTSAHPWPERDVPIVFVDRADDASRAAVREPVAPISLAGPDNPTYVMYTSGSTARPKAVVGLHRGLMNRLLWMASHAPLAPDDVCGHRTSLAFVDSICEVFGPLLVGARLVVVRQAAARDVETLIHTIRAEQMTRVTVVPSLLRVMMDVTARSTDPPAALRLCVSSGEPVSADDLARYRRLFPGARLLNLYGTTEISADVTYSFSTDAPPGTAHVSIGRPMQNTRVCLLDEGGRGVAPGVVGEVVVGGVALARGYLHAPDLTAERFVPDAAGQSPGARAYRTGDLGYLDADGCVQLRGRIDLQVKLRGHRIDPAEVETVLGRHPNVRESVVVLAEGGSHLLAYFVARGDAPDAATLRRFLRTRLPEYLVPLRFVRLEAMPRTPSGKIARPQLPPPGPIEEEDFLPPRTPLEARIAAVWSEVLAVRPVGVRSNFFSLGGHSLLAAQLVHRLRGELGRHVPLRALFELPTVEELAASLERAEAEAPAVEGWPSVAPDPDARHEPFPLTDMQQAYWAGRTQAMALGNVSIHGYLELEADALDVDRFAAAWRLVVNRHDMLRAIVTPDCRQRILKEVPPYDICVGALADEAAIDAQVKAIRADMSHQMLPLTEWPAFDIRASCHRGRVRLHISIDTFFLDGWSLQLLVRELLQAYADPAALPAAPEFSFRDYALAQRSLVDTPEHARALEEWRQRLAALAPAPDLPLARRPETLPKTEFRKLATSFDADLAGRLQERARAAGLSLPHVLLGAYGRMLARWSASPRLTINVPTFNRLPFHADVNALAGPFSSFTIVELDATGAGVETLARQAQRELSWALDHQIVSGVRVVRELMQREGFRVLPVVFTSLGFDLERGTTRAPAAALDGLREVYSVAQTPQVWIDNRVGFSAGRTLTIEWDVVDDLFPPGMVDDMFAVYCGMIRELADDPHAWRDEALLALPPRHEEVLAAVNATAGLVWDERLETGFLRMARRAPAAVAIVAADRTLSYADVDRESAAIAATVRAAGCGPGTRVAVVTESGWQGVIAALGTLRGGAAYVPIDPEVPAERLAWMLSDADVSFVLTQSSVATRLARPAASPLVSVEDALKARTADLAAAPLEDASDVDAVAYVMYTSGSTGQPKGVVMPHRGAVNTVRAVIEHWGIGPDDRVLGLSRLSFDLSVFDLFGTLGSGAALVLPEPAARREPRRWWEIAARNRVTVWNSVPALMNLLVDYAAATDVEAGGSALGTLRLALLSGDWIPVRLPDAVRRLAPDCRVVSLGGPTETAIWSVGDDVGEVQPEWTSIPYGRPLANQRSYILGESGEPCPIWVPGELYVAGRGLANGYWRDEARTAAAFTRHAQPLPGAPDGERLYRTGDRARFWPDGTIELLGRVDHQIKLHGLRIDPGEIEALLLEHPEVKAAAVVPSESGAGESRLVAYIVRRRGVEPPAASPADAASARAAALKKLEFRLRQPGVRRFDDTWERVALPAPERTDDTYLARRSHRRFRREPLSPDMFGAVLACLRQLELTGFPLPKYRYASAGNLYPVQVYLYLKASAVSGIGAGYYYYHPREHRLVRLSDAPALEARRFGADNAAIFESAAFALFLVAQMEAIEPIYGDVSARFAALEAGLVAQLLEMTAGASGVALCQIGGVDFAGLDGRFALDPSHVLMHVIVGGPRQHDIDSWDAFRRDAERGGARAATDAARPEPELAQHALFAQLRETLKRALPHYMVPSAFATIDRLPMSANGKVDRTKLPKITNLPAPPAGDTGQAPLASVLSEMCAQTLQIPEVNRDDNFFELGGSSLTAIGLTTMIRDVFGVSVPITRFLEAPTIATLATLVEEARSADGSEQPAPLPLVAPDPATRHEPFPLTDIQQAYWIGRTSAMPLGGVATHSYVEIDFDALDAGRLSEAFTRLLARHEMLRAVIDDEGRQRILPRVSPYEIPVVDCRREPEADVASRLLEARTEMSHQVFPVGEWPLFELRVHRLGDRDRLHISTDLMMADARSVQILRREMLALYENPDVALPPIDFSFRDYVLAARALESSPQYDRARSYWLDRIDTLPPAPRLPLRGTITGASGRGFSRLQGSLDRRTWTALRAEASRRRVTPSAALCTAFARVLAAWSEAPQFTVNLTTFGRLPLHPDVPQLVGDFTATTLLQLDMRDRVFERSAVRVQRQIWSDLEHRLFGGVRVLREMSRRGGRVGFALGPVVFTSMLANGADAAGTSSTLGGHIVFSISQTPQVVLDHQVAEFEGRLTYSWDFVSALFPEGVVDAMFETYGELLTRLAAGEGEWVA
jgi:amino acid adenylation domain-containing protein